MDAEVGSMDLETTYASRLELLKSIPIGGLAVEVGTWKGDFAAEILEVLQPKDFVLIDTWGDYWDQPGDEIYASARKRFEGFPQVQLWRGHSLEMIPRLPDRTVAFAYIDADHLFDAVLADLEAMLPKMAPGGWLCGHDYCCSDKFGVVRAVAVFCDRHGLTLGKITDEPLAPILGSHRLYYEPDTSYNSFGIHVS